MLSGVVGSLLAMALAVPFCGPGALEECRELLLAEIGVQRAAAGLAPVAVHPTLERIARDRAWEIAAGGSVDPNLTRLRGTTRRIYREGYAPHDWTEGVLIGRWGHSVFGQWREVKPRWYESVRGGDYEHVGVGVARLEEQPVLALIFGLTRRTVDWRRAEPLRDVAWVRTVLLAEVNRLRRETGRAALAPHPGLDSVAQEHAEDMLRRAFYDHRNPDGESPGERVRRAGYGRPRMVAENIAKGHFTPAETVERWMNSSGHRRNILQRRVTLMGSGVAFGENENGFEVVWVQVFTSGAIREARAPAGAR